MTFMRDKADWMEPFVNTLRRTSSVTFRRLQRKE